MPTKSAIKATKKEKPVKALQKSAEGAVKRVRKVRAQAASSNGLPIEEHKRFVYWLEEFRDEPGVLGLTADAALSSIGAFTITLCAAVDSVQTSSSKP